ncbi:MAG: hypothetical protein A3F17_02315 [Gammaproteobacteria bacterium RIFCSPHIGHO2_12_FULL_41_15]|nr:MAG: hypothetical protein A3F17_02315 [Gammaproteobacteria bacterium RIFCSPHIGHO2_12_FULL_41_15]
MFAVIYRFKLKPDQEKTYLVSWNKITDYFIAHRGALGSCLHKGEDGLWVAYSRWPDKATRDASWSQEKKIADELPIDIQNVIKPIQEIKAQNQDMDQYEEICLEMMEDKLLNPKKV